MLLLDAPPHARRRNSGATKTKSVARRFMSNTPGTGESEEPVAAQYRSRNPKAGKELSGSLVMITQKGRAIDGQADIGRRFDGWGKA
jgi:hypothetical protein